MRMSNVDLYRSWIIGGIGLDIMFGLYNLNAGNFSKTYSALTRPEAARSDSRLREGDCHFPLIWLPVIGRPGRNQCSNSVEIQCIDRDIPAKHLQPPGSEE